MGSFKQFLFNQRLQELNEGHIIFNENITEKIYSIIDRTAKLKFKDGEYYRFYGELKAKLKDFINYWTIVINSCIKEKELLIQNLDKEGFVEIINGSIATQEVKQEQFRQFYLPTQTKQEEDHFNRIEELYKLLEPKMQEIRLKLHYLDTQKSFKEYCVHHLDISVRKKNESFWIAHGFIAVNLAGRAYQIRVSLDEIVKRLRNNLNNLKKYGVEHVNELHAKLYELNKERREVSRRSENFTTDIAEVDYAVEKIRQKIEKVADNLPINKVEEELRFWGKKLKNFTKIHESLMKTENELNKVKEYRNLAATLKDSNERVPCLQANRLNELLDNRQQYLSEYYTEVARTIITYFTVRGSDRVIYHDHIGEYSIDEFGHHIYLFDAYQKRYHVDCKGNYKQYTPLDEYYYDANGRYLIKNKEKVYQCGPCTSSYRLDENSLLKKTTVDCGHSERPSANCYMQIKDKKDFIHLPKADPVDIKGTLSAETTKYLWNNFGHCLPPILTHVLKLCPLNPIPYIGHCLIQHRYLTPKANVQQGIDDASEFRTSIHQKISQRYKTENEAWNAKLIKRSAPEDTFETDAHQRLYQHQQMKQQMKMYEMNPDYFD